MSDGFRFVFLLIPVILVVAAFALRLHVSQSPVYGELSCGGGGDVVVVVYNSATRELAEEMASFLRGQLASISNHTRVCTMPVSKLGFTPRVLPEVLVGTSVPAELFKGFVLNETLVDGLRPLAYDVNALLALRLAYRHGYSPPVYNYNMTLIILQGSIPETSVNVSRLASDNVTLNLLSALFAARITGFRVFTVEDSKAVGALGNFSTRPVLLAYSREDLSLGTLGVVRINDTDYYGVKGSDTIELLEGRGLVPARELLRRPPNLAGHPKIGGGRIHVAVFEDFACPFCAHFYAHGLDTLLSLAENNTITLHLADLIVHSNIDTVRRLHVLLLCKYLETGNDTGYVDMARTVYHVFSREGLKGLSMLLDQLDREMSLKNVSCGKAESLVSESNNEALRLGIRGTPSFVVWVDDVNRVYVVTGYKSGEFLASLIAHLASMVKH